MTTFRTIESRESGREICEEETCSELAVGKRGLCRAHRRAPEYFGRRPQLPRDENKSLEQRNRDATAEVLRELRARGGVLEPHELIRVCRRHAPAGGIILRDIKRWVRAENVAESWEQVPRYRLKLRSMHA